jgi:hypothetical protein
MAEVTHSDTDTQQPTIAALTGFIEESVARLKDQVEFTVKREQATEFLLLFGACARTIRYADAYLTLAGSGFSLEGVPLARAALEHAITAQWVSILEGGVDRFRVDTAHGHKEHYETLATWLNNDELAAEVKNMPILPTGKRMPKFTQMMRELDKDKFLETSYHILSQQVHVSHSTVFSFLDWEDDTYTVKYDQQNPYEYQTVYVAAVACMLVRCVIAKLTNDEEELTHLDVKSDKLILPMTLEDEVPLDKRRS